MAPHLVFFDLARGRSVSLLYRPQAPITVYNQELSEHFGAPRRVCVSAGSSSVDLDPSKSFAQLGESPLHLTRLFSLADDACPG